MQQIGAEPVDFCNQLGIYLLYDGREVIYVGRTTDRPLGKRLYEHTIDRMSARWDRFSWFGLLPVSDDGSLGELSESYEAANFSRLNRDDFSEWLEDYALGELWRKNVIAEGPTHE